MREGSLLIMHMWGLVFASLRHMGRGFEEKGGLRPWGQHPGLG